MRIRSWSLSLVVTGAATLLVPASPAVAVAALAIEPLTWNIVGLDSNDVSEGPNQFLTGARVCNTGDAPATNASATLIWEAPNPYITLAGPDTVALGDVAAGACSDAYFLVEVTRDPAAYLTSRDLRIEATADGLGVVSTPRPRELLVEQLISQARNQALTLIGPTDVWVGETVVYDVTASTATNGYDQLQNFLPFPHGMFRLVAIEQTYTAPPGGTNDRPYADACGWDHDPNSPTYRTCVGPGEFPGLRAGGDLTTRYTLEVVGPGVADLTDLIYDYSGSSYHYNADFGVLSLRVTAREPIDLELDKVASDTAPTVGLPFDYTITLSNTSPTDATGVTVTDTPPAGLRLVSATTTAGTFDITTGSWTVGDVAAGASVSLVITAVADAVGDLTNQAEVTSADQPDRDSTPANGDPTEDDISTATVTPVAPSLAIDKVAGDTSVLPGDRLSYTVTASNVGARPAVDVRVSDPLPAGASYVAGTTAVDGSAVPDVGGTSPLVAGIDLGTLAPGDVVSITYVVTATGGAAELVNTATLSSPSTPDLTATTSTPVVLVLPQTGLDPGERTSWNLALVSLLLGWALVGMAHRIDRHDRLRAIRLARIASARAAASRVRW